MEGNLHIIVCSVWAMVFADSYWENFSFRFPKVIYITNFLICFFFFLKSCKPSSVWKPSSLFNSHEAVQVSNPCL